MTHKYAPFVLLAAFYGTIANADNVNCMVHGNIITCNGQSDGTDRQGNAAQGISDFIGTLNENSFRKKIGKMLASGDCAGATDYALQKGRLELAVELRRSCVAHFGQSTARVSKNKADQSDISRMVANGDCKGAIQLAYQRGNVALGDSILNTCKVNIQP
jgi:hypothetical protein